MSESVYPLAAFGLGMVLTATFLCLGLWVGYQAGRAAVAPKTGLRRTRGRRLARLLRELDACVVLGQQAAREAQQLTASMSAASPGKAHNVAAAARHLSQTSTSLIYRLEELAGGARGRTGRNLLAERKSVKNTPLAEETKRADRLRPQPLATTTDEHHSSLSVQELGQFTELEHGQVGLAEELNRRRFPYNCVQTILRWSPSDAQLPSRSDGVTVRCQDISGQGISFFWPTQPDFEHLIISLGSDHDLLFMAAQVMHFTPIEIDCEQMFLVGCRFIRRMNELTAEWSGELKRQSDLDLVEEALMT